MSLHSSRSRSPEEKDSNSEPERPRSPSPIPRIINEECYRSAHAVFIKRWFRGHNTCSRCDFEYVAVRGGQPPRRPDDKSSQRSSRQLHQHPQQVHSSKVAATSSHCLIKEIKEEKKPDVRDIRDIRREERVPSSPVPRKKPHMDTASADAQITSFLMGGTALPPYMMDHPAFRGYPMMHDPTPALRQLSEYAKPHIGGMGNPDRVTVSGAGFDPFNRFPGFYQTGSKDRSEVDPEKRGDRLENRNRESWETKEKIKSEMDFKPQGPPS